MGPIMNDYIYDFFYMLGERNHISYENYRKNIKNKKIKNNILWSKINVPSLFYPCSF